MTPSATAGGERKTQAELKSSVSVVEEVARREGLDPELISTLAGVVATWDRGEEENDPTFDRYGNTCTYLPPLFHS